MNLLTQPLAASRSRPRLQLSLRWFLLFSALASLVCVPLVRFAVSRWGERQIHQLSIGENDSVIRRIVFRAGGNIVVCDDPIVCKQLTDRFCGSQTPADHIANVGEHSVCCDYISIELSNGAVCKGVGIVGMRGMRLSLPPGNRVGWDYAFTHFVRLDNLPSMRVHQLLTELTGNGDDNE